MATYDTLRRQSRTLESLVDAKLTAYTRLASSLSLGQDVEAGGSAARRDDMEQEIEGLLEKVWALQGLKWQLVAETLAS